MYMFIRNKNVSLVNIIMQVTEAEDLSRTYLGYNNSAYLMCMDVGNQ